MSTVELKRIANVYTGFSLRESVSYLAHGDTKLLQVKDLPNGNSIVIEANNLTHMVWRYDSKPQYLENGAVVLLARGAPKAYVFDGERKDKVIVGHIFIVITLTTDLIIPDYLAWYINYSSGAKKHFDTNSTGSVLNMTGVTTVKGLPVVIPTIEEQEKFIDRHHQMNEDINALQRMIELRQEYSLALNETLLNQIQIRQQDSKLQG